MESGRLPPSGIAAKKVTNLSLVQKFNVIEDFEQKGLTVKGIAEKLNCGKTQIYNIVKSKTSIRQKYLESDDNKKLSKKQRDSKYDEVNQVVYEWYCTERSSRKTVTGPMLQKHANDVAAQRGFADFKGSNGWLGSFKKRFNISLKESNCDNEFETVHDVALNCSEHLQSLTKGYELRNIASMASTVLFYRAMPHRVARIMSRLANNDCGVRTKDMVSILLVCFADGTCEKPIVVATNERPKSFKQLSMDLFPVTYIAAKQDCRSVDKLLRVLTALNDRMKAEKRRILLFVDKSMHNELLLSFSHVRVECSATLLSNDIIPLLKAHYRNLLLKDVLTRGNSCDKTTILDAIYILAEACKSIPPSTIQRSFSNCGFSVCIGDNQLQQQPQDEDSYESVLSEIEQLIAIYDPSYELGAKAFVALDEGVGLVDSRKNENSDEPPKSLWHAENAASMDANRVSASSLREFLLEIGRTDILREFERKRSGDQMEPEQSDCKQTKTKRDHT